VRALADHPEEWRLLRDDPDRARKGTEEVLRWVTPAPLFLRTVTSDVVIRDTLLPRDSQVVIWLVSANRDEDVFEEPGRFDMARWPNHHLSFGTGAHTCLGAPVARLELRILLQELAANVRAVEVFEPIPHLQSVNTVGPARLDVAFQ